MGEGNTTQQLRNSTQVPVCQKSILLCICNCLSSRTYVMLVGSPAASNWLAQPWLRMQPLGLAAAHRFFFRVPTPHRWERDYTVLA